MYGRVISVVLATSSHAVSVAAELADALQTSGKHPVSIQVLLRHTNTDTALYTHTLLPPKSLAVAQCAS